MTDDDDSRPWRERVRGIDISTPSPRSVAVVCLVGVLLLSGPIAAAVTSTFTVPTSGEVPVSASNGPTVTITGSDGLGDATFLPDTNAVYVHTSSGNATFRGTGPSDVTVAVSDLTGTETAVTGLGVSTNSLTIAPEDKPNVTVGGAATTLSFRTMTISDGAQDFSYGADGTASVTVRGLATDTAVAAVDAGTGEALDNTVTDGNGTATFDALPSGSHNVVLQEATGAPVFVETRPVGPQSDYPSEVAVNVSDDGFPGGEVEVKIWVDGTLQTTQNITSQSTVTASVSPTVGDTVEWRAEATDGDGLTSTTGQLQFRTPANLTLRNESAPNQIINTTGSANLTFLGETGTVVTRPIENGNVTMDGLPTTESFVIVVSEVDGYQSRRVVVESLVEQQNVYLLPENATSVEIDFGVDDATGQFPSGESRLIVSKAITLDGETKFRAVAGGRFGAVNSLPLFLERDQTYRLEIENGEQTRSVGEYVASRAQRELIPIGTVKVGSKQSAEWGLSTDITTTDSGQSYIRASYVDEGAETNKIDISVTNQTSGEEIYNISETTSVNGYSELIPIPDKDGSYTLEYDIARESGDIQGDRQLGSVAAIAGRIPIDSRWSSLISYVMIIGMGGLTVIVSGRLAAMTMTITAVALTTLGFVAIPVPALGLAAVASLLYAIRGGGLV